MFLEKNLPIALGQIEFCEYILREVRFPLPLLNSFGWVTPARMVGILFAP